MESNGVEWSGVEWNDEYDDRVEWNVEWNRVDQWSGIGIELNRVSE